MTALDIALAGTGLFVAAALSATVASSRVGAALSAIAGALVVAAALAVLYGWPTAGASLAWRLFGAPVELLLDPLAAMFLVPIGIVGALGSIYGTGYWDEREHPGTARPVRAAYTLLTASMCLVVMAQSGGAFLVAWEVMALGAFFLVATEHARAEVQAAAYIYLVAAHFATLGLWWMFARIEVATGVFGFAPLAGGTATTLTVLLALVAFGFKAGFIPLHVWLPPAHASAPTHVSAILSGVVLKVGIYGIMRITSLASELPAVVGGLVFGLGAVSAIAGVAFALGQHDLKRLLAYHSIENIGIILLGLGLALLGRRFDQPSWVVLGLAGALLHVWNHAFFKALLFLASGSVIHAVGTRTIDRLGGLARRQPWTAALFAVGAVAICGLPPLNGFVSELLIYLGLFDGSGPVAIGAPILALVGGLALACFVKVYGVVFLGVARTPEADAAHEAPASMLVPMAILALLCALIGLLPWLLAPALDRVIASVTGSSELPRVADIAPLVEVSAFGIALIILVAVVFAIFRPALARAPRTGTWDCGYAEPTARMQYTASSFADTIVRLFRFVLRPRVHPPDITGIHPRASRFEVHVEDTVLEGAVLPSFRQSAKALARARQLQSGRIQLYVLYLLIAVIAALAATLPFDEFLDALRGGLTP